ncbi:MAG: hypothetical protein K1X86_07265 [Ignavibacteria bacterium]|nr:hypothetical protein [Ignavibacteria bacterium]
MKSIHSKNYITIISLCLISFGIYQAFNYYFTKGILGVPLDDSWIHFRFAENFAKEFNFTYNPGEPTAGTTSPLWVIVSGLVSFISPTFMLNSIILSGLFFILSCIFIYKIAVAVFFDSEVLDFDLEFSPLYLALLVALLTIMSGRLEWAAMSGMETTMFIFFSLAGFYQHIKDIHDKKISLAPSLLFALSTASRPEGLMLFGLYLFDAWTFSFHIKKVLKTTLDLAAGVIIFIFIAGGYFLFSYYTSGNILPNTFRGQGGGFHIDTEHILISLEYLRINFVLFIRDNPITCILYLLSFIFYFANVKKFFSKLRSLNLIYLWVILLPLASSIFVPNWRHHGRYLMPLIPLINLVSVYAILVVLNKFKGKSSLNLLHKKNFLTALLLFFSFAYYIVYAIALGKNTDNINSQQVKLAHWVKENISQNDVIAMNDIGAITFVSKNRIVDMAGLVTPQILDYRKYRLEDNLDSMLALLKNNDVKYMIIYDHWFEPFLKRHGEYFEYLLSAKLEVNTICGGDEMKVYKTNFYRKENEGN